MAFWRGGPVWLPRMGDVRNGPELSQFQMKIYIGELFLEAHADFLGFLAQAERQPEWVAVRNSPELSQFPMKICIGESLLEAHADFLDFLAQAERQPEWVVVRNSPELRKFPMKICIGELLLEAHAGFPDFLAQAERPRFGIHSTPLCCALSTKRGGLSFVGPKSGNNLPGRLGPASAPTGFLKLRAAALCQPSEACHSGKDAEFRGPEWGRCTTAQN